MNRVETLDVGDHEIDGPLMTEQRRMVVWGWRMDGCARVVIIVRRVGTI